MKRNHFFVLVFTLCCLGVFQVNATTPSQLAQEAQEAYQSGDYPRAIRHWQDLISLGYRNGALFQNLGSAFWKQGEGGEARLYFLKAMLWSPRSPTIRHNLKYIDATLKIEPSQRLSSLFLYSKISYYRVALNFRESFFFSALGSFLFALLIVFGIHPFSKRRSLLVFPMLICLYAVPQLLFQAHLIYGSQNGVVLQDQAALLKLPSAQATVVEKIREGTDIMLRKKQGDYGLVRLDSGQEGWLSLSAIGEI